MSSSKRKKPDSKLSSTNKAKSKSNKPLKSKINPQITLNSSLSSTSEESKESVELNNIIAEALERHKKDIIIQRQNKLKDLGHLSMIAEEYLSAFILIGYSLQNEKFVVFNASNSKDEAALVDLLRSTFIEIASSRP